MMERSMAPDRVPAPDDRSQPPRETDLLASAGRIARFGGWHVDLESDVVHWSDEVYAIHEVETGRSITLEQALEFYPPEARARLGAAWKGCLEMGAPYDLELPMITAAGREIWVNTRGAPARDPEGRIVRVQGAFQDVTRRRRAEERAGDLEIRLAQTLEQMSDAFFTVDEDWRFTFVNSEAARLFDRDRSELLHRVCWDAFPLARDTPIESEARAAAESGARRDFEARLPKLGIWVSAKIHPVSDGLAVYFRDITERRERVKQLAEQASLLERARDAIVVWDEEGRVSYWNQGAERILGWSKEDAEGRAAVRLLNLDPEVMARAHATLCRDGEWSGEVQVIAATGKRVLLDARWTLLSDEDDPTGGDPDGGGGRILTINTDVTEKRRLLDQFLRAQRLESMGTMAGGVAHDLNNILAPILMNAELLRGTVSHPADVESLETILTCTKRGSALLERILSFSRGVDMDRTDLDIAEVVEGALAIVRRTFPRDIRIDSRHDADLWPVLADRTQIGQVLMNLFVNARDAMPSGGELSVEVGNVVVGDDTMGLPDSPGAGRYTMIDVQDSGMGVEPTTLKRIFDPFFTTKESGRGTGLGLSTVDTIVRSHGGFVRAYSEPGVGSRFRVYLPACDAAASCDDSPTPGRPSNGGDTAGLDGNGELILVVDDEELIAHDARRAVEAHGYRVMTAADGAEALAVFAERRNDISLIVIDVMMPVMDGVSAIRALRRLDPEVPIIAATGLASSSKRQRLHNEGVQSVLAKPYDAGVLLRAIHGELNGTTPGSA